MNFEAVASSTTTSAFGVSHPPSLRRDQRFLRQSFSIGRIEKRQRERLERMHRAKLRGVAAEDARDAAKAERLDVFAQQRTGLRAVVDKQDKAPRRARIASMPSAPVPEKRSSTRAPSIDPA